MRFVPHRILRPLHVDIAKWTQLTDYLARVAARPAVKAAMEAEGNSYGPNGLYELAAGLAMVAQMSRHWAIAPGGRRRVFRDHRSPACPLKDTNNKTKCAAC
jgi:hypothetical protein